MSEPQANPSRPGTSTEARLPLGVLVGLLIAITAVLVGGAVADHLLKQRKLVSAQVLREAVVLERSYAALDLLRDLEAAPLAHQLAAAEAERQRYEAAARALGPQLQSLAEALSELPDQAQRVQRLQALGLEQADEAGRAVALRSAGQDGAAAAILGAPRWQQRSRDISTLMQALVAAQQGRMAAGREAGLRVSHAVTIYIFGNSLALLVLIAIGAGAALVSHRRQRGEHWLRAGQDGLAAAIEGEARLERLGEAALDYLRRYLDAESGVLYVLKDDGGGRRIAAQGPTSGTVSEWEFGSGPLAPLSPGRRSLPVTGEGEPPPSTERGPARLLGSCLAGGRLVGGVELHFARGLRPDQQQLLDSVAEPLGAALRRAMDTQRLNALLDQSLSMAEEMRDRRDELSAKTIVLSERTENLNAAHAQLATQQAALEQVNTRLEEKMELLESQKEELRQSQDTLVEQAVELERANRYKNTFLANMSHELRTPLNSALILSKVLAENSGGRLNSKEVSYAETIHSAGSDLLTLINDILDLAKIEAGRVTLHPERVLLQPVMQGLVRGFEPTAALKSLQLDCVLEQGLPHSIVTDEYRLGQILKNLLSNAIKFTRAGEIQLRVSPGAAGGVRFAVRDTGIGIPEEHREHIFEAFRQADGSTHREFGGTGLGLSISRDLARILGGTISLHSTPGVGSVFTLDLPAELPAVAREGEAVAPAREPSQATGTTAAGPGGEPAGPGQPRVLIIEDDLAFAGILCELAADFGFASQHTPGASQGFGLAVQLQPEAILLDVNLPDQSGLALLERLKQDRRTRHIPVSVVSVADHRQQALERGAIGYTLKPVAREQLVETFRQLQARTGQSPGRVLLMTGEALEPDLRELLGSSTAEIAAVRNRAEALSALRQGDYHCLVLDLRLPPEESFGLLEQLEVRGTRLPPPVIAYASQPLSPDQQQALRRHARVLVLKDARTPARLLDEVTLFTHTVESQLPAELQRLLDEVRIRERALEDRCVLLAEDDPRNIFALTAVLERKGMKVRLARNGREALAALEPSPTEPPIDLVLMDIMMPEMDGITAIREIRKNPALQRLPIIALTAKAMQDDQAACLGAGANDYMAKPLDNDRLLSLIRMWMSR